MPTQAVRAMSSSEASTPLAANASDATSTSRPRLRTASQRCARAISRPPCPSLPPDLDHLGGRQKCLPKTVDKAEGASGKLTEAASAYDVSVSRRRTRCKDSTARAPPDGDGEKTT